MSNAQTPSTVGEVTTPCFLVDLDRLKKNCQRMLDTCARLKVDLRHHTKTHKTVEAADIQTEGKRRKIACSTLPECDLYADNGFEDILLAYPISADKVPRCAQLTNRLQEFHVMVSGGEGLRSLQQGSSLLAEGKRWSVLLELDCGYGRTGLPNDSPELLKIATDLQADPKVKLQGLYTHCGQSYDFVNLQEHKDGQKALVERLLGAAHRLRAAGIEVPVVGTGSTPTCSLADQVLEPLDEFHPGNYIFYDYEQLLLGACRQEQIACCVATRVVCHRQDLNCLVVDCGFLGLSHDGRAQRGDDICVVRDHPHLRMTYNSQELGKLEPKDGESINFDDYPVGTMLFIYPYHSCATAAMYTRYIVHSGQKVVGVWTPVKGW